MDLFHENLFAAAAVERGYLRTEQVDECRRLQAKAQELGLLLSLPQVCEAHRVLTPEQMTELELSVRRISAQVRTPDLPRRANPATQQDDEASGTGEGGRFDERGAPDRSDSGFLPLSRDLPPFEGEPVPAWSRGSGCAPRGDPNLDHTVMAALSPPPGAYPEATVPGAAPVTLGPLLSGVSPTPGNVTILEGSGDGSPPPAVLPAASALGQVGEYALLRELGRGGMGVVYEAIQTSLGRRVALKVLNPAAISEEKVQRFKREAEAVAKLNHRNIIKVYGAGQDANKVYWYAMEYLEGKTADVVAMEEKPPLARIARWGSHAADALDYAHSLGIIHRDIKPANLMVVPGDNLVIMDYGLARDLSASELTASGQVLGTPRYMSPEQAEGERGGIDGRTDIYSLGASLYELLAGRPLFEGETVAAILQKIIFEEPASLCARCPAVPKDLETIVFKSLAKEPERRYATAGELHEDLERFLRGDPILARPASLLAKGIRKVRRNRALSATVAVSLVVVGSVSAAYLLHRRGSEARAREMARGNGLLESREFQAAIEVYSRVLDEKPDLQEARLQRARALALKGDRAGARADLDVVLAAEPRSGRALLERGQLRSREGDAPGAVQDLSGALEASPGNDLALVARGWALVDAGDLPAAGKDFDAAAEATHAAKLRALALCGQGVVAMSRGESERARTLFDLAVETDIECYRAYLERGRAHQAAGRYGQAVQDLTQAVKRETKGFEALLERARAYHSQFSEESALADCREAASRAPADFRPLWAEARYTYDAQRSAELTGRVLAANPLLAEAWALQGWLRLVRGEAAAASDFQRALDLRNGWAEALAGLAGAALRHGDVDAALELSGRAVAADPEFGEAHGARAEALEKKGDSVAAREEYALSERFSSKLALEAMSYARMWSLWDEFHNLEKRKENIEGMETGAWNIVRIAARLIRVRPHFALAPLLAARALWMINEPEKALLLANQALQRDPFLGEAYLFRARLRTDHARTRDPAAGLADAERAAQLLPDDARALERIGLARYYQDDFGGALEAYDRALKKAPDLAVLHRRRADALRRLEQLSECEEAQARARKARPDRVASREYLNLGHYCTERKKYELGVFYCTRALDEDPNSREALSVRATAFSDSGRIDLSLLDQARATEIDSASAVTLFSKADRYLTKSKMPVQVVVNVIENLVRSNPKDAGAIGLRSFLHYLLRNPEAGIRDADRALELNPDFTVMYSLRGIQRVRLGELEKALPDLLEGDRRAPEAGMPQYFMSQYLAVTGHKEQAIALLKKCMTLGFENFKDIIRREKHFDSLASEPEFQKLVQER
ncbi:MAG: protein kinase [Planctomycetes bacterium]|nr:protein kinase [Planctomycetota bacterium]